jgi:hypothetical protein
MIPSISNLFVAYGAGRPPRRWRIRWAVLARLLSAMTALFGLLRVLLELWARSG